MIHIVRPTALVVNANGEPVGLVSIAFVSKAPFPQLPSVSPQRMAVMQMLARCKPEASKLCGATPEQPICPMSLARCLASQKDQLSETCHTGLSTLSKFMQHDSDTLMEHHHGEAQPMHLSVLHEVSLYLHEMHWCKLPAIMLIIFLVISCCMGLCKMPEEEQEGVHTTEDVVSQPYHLYAEPEGIILTAPVVKFSVTSSEDQV